MIRDASERDACEYVEASYEDHPVDHIEPAPLPDGWESEAITEILRQFAVARNGRLLAYSFLMLINRCPYSEQEIGEHIGVTKQAVSKTKRRLERWLSMKARNGRTDDSIKKFRRLALARAARQRNGGGMEDYLKYRSGATHPWVPTAMLLDSIWPKLPSREKYRLRAWSQELASRPIPAA